jgi:hypothetical protein
MSMQKLTPQLDNLRKAITAISQVDLIRAGSPLIEKRVVSELDLRPLGSALNAFKHFFEKIGRSEKSN